jgi:M-phase inducer tyrosine phosphatase
MKFRRKRSIIGSRPPFARTRASSSNNVRNQNGSPDSPQLPLFKFGAGTAGPLATAMSLDEAFAVSPPQERRPHPSASMANLMGPPRPRQPFSGLSGPSRNGSPVYGQVRKQSAPTARPRKQFRRSLSMFEHPGDVINQTHEKPCLQSIQDVEECHKPRLPHFIPEDNPDSLPRIHKETFIDILDGKHSHDYDQTMIVDCRFEYEYEGGHIEGAVNFNDKEALGRKLFELHTTPNTLLIFHCEYSAHRAPIM